MDRRLTTLNFNLIANCNNVKNTFIASFIYKLNLRAFLQLNHHQVAHENPATQSQVVDGWLQNLKQHSLETYEHSLRVAQLTVQFAKTIGMGNATQLAQLKVGALLHDIGKIAVSPEILKKTTPLTTEECLIIKRHPETAYEWLQPIDFLRPSLDIPRYHHERWNGVGYPHGLKGDAIPLGARLCAITDYWDALSNERAYRGAVCRTDVLEMIQHQAGTLFDPTLAPIFVQMMQR